MKIFFLLFTIFIVLFNNVLGLPMYQNGEHKDSKVLFLTPNAKEQHRGFEEELYLHHFKDVIEHEQALRNKSVINPTRLQNKYQKDCATKRCDHNTKNIAEIEKVPNEGGFVHLTKTKSGKGRHYQSITNDQADVLKDRQMSANKH